jgi:hypothetical protein
MPFCREALLIHLCRKVVFANGVRKVSMPDGSTVIHFTNGDLKEATADGKCDSSLRANAVLPHVSPTVSVTPPASQALCAVDSCALLVCVWIASQHCNMQHITRYNNPPVQRRRRLNAARGGIASLRQRCSPL